MCGILGIAGDPRRVDGVDLQPGMAALRHRGPDDSGSYKGGLESGAACALGFTRLAILDLSPAGHQPMISDDGGLVIVFNGEVFNFREIRRDLEELGFRFRSSGDTEVVLNAYIAWGRGCLARFRGMFAFAIWNTRDSTLFLARDRLGIKPLYYSTNGGCLAFASEVRALLACRLVEARLSNEAVLGFLSTGSVQEPETILENVWALPPGHVLEYRGGEAAIHEYWELPRPCAGGSASLQETAEALRPLLEESVRLRLVSDVPLGVFLSGGIDSTALLALASREISGIRAFTMSFDEARFDEWGLASRVADRFGCRHDRVHLTDEEATRDFEHALDAMDQPSADGLNTYFVSRAARSAGLTVALSGLGGDELFAGYRGFAVFTRTVQAGRVSALVPDFVTRGVSRAFTGGNSLNRTRKAIAVAEAGGDPASTYGVLRALFTRPEIDRLTGGRAQARRAEAPLLDLVDGDLVNLYSRLELRGYLRNTLLRDTDAMSMANSLEARVPLLDHLLVERILAVPGSLKLSQKQAKPLLAATVPELPDEVIRGRKQGFVLPMAVWFRGRLKGKVEELLLGGGLPMLESKVVREYWRAFQRGERFVSHARILGLAALSRWCVRNGVGSQVDSRGPVYRSVESAPPTSRASRPRVLVSTIPPMGGGVTTMTRFIVECLERQGLAPVLAYYIPYSIAPGLSVPSFAAPFKSVSSRRAKVLENRDAVEVGAWLPELEFSHYRLNDHWRDLIRSCTFHVAVSGNCLAAQPFVESGTSFVLWVATPWRDDRRQRERTFGPPRKVLDRLVVRPVTERLESRILSHGTVLALSEYTREAIRSKLASDHPVGLLPMPIDADLFRPEGARLVPGRIGFVGRLSDPRKNVGLFLDVLETLLKDDPKASGLLVGGDLPASLQARAERLGQAGALTVLPSLEQGQLPEHLQTVDVFLVPSRQEGLCIAALEAMACGCPVVSTPCGGVEDFVVEGSTGFVGTFDAVTLADRVRRVTVDRDVRARMSRESRRLVEERFSRDTAERIFMDAFRSTFATRAHVVTGNVPFALGAV